MTVSRDGKELSGEALLDQQQIDSLMLDALRMSPESGSRVMALHWLARLSDVRMGWPRSSDFGKTSESLEDAISTSGTQHTSLGDAVEALSGLSETLESFQHIVRPGKKTRAAMRTVSKPLRSGFYGDLQRSWLIAEMESLSPDPRGEAGALIHQLNRKHARSRRRVVRAFERHFDPALPSLNKRLSSFKQHCKIGSRDRAPVFADELANQLTTSLDTLLREIAKWNSSELSATSDRDMLPETLAILRQHCILLEPFSEFHSCISGWFHFARSGLNALNAASLALSVAKLSEKRAMTSLARVARVSAAGHMEAFRAEWARDEEALSNVQHAARVGIAELLRASVDELLPREVERKYLLRALPSALAGVAPVSISQGWLPGTVLRERLRRTTHPDGTIQLTRTVKAGSLRERVELEDEADVFLFDAMWPFTRNARIHKDRYSVADGGLIWEIDFFPDRDLAVAEVELERPEQVPEPPEWLSGWIVREVTGDPRFANSSMARPDIHGDVGGNMSEVMRQHEVDSN